MEKIIYVGSAYLAPVEYYTKLFAYDKVYVCLLYTSDAADD